MSVWVPPLVCLVALSSGSRRLALQLYPLTPPVRAERAKLSLRVEWKLRPQAFLRTLAIPLEKNPPELLSLPSLTLRLPCRLMTPASLLVIPPVVV